MKTAKCSAKSCGADIIWAETESGKRMPFDAQPHPDGRWFLDDSGTLAKTRTGAPLALYIPEGSESQRETRKPHHATCPAVAEFRKGKRA